jgi:Tfp pilus assembly protein PilZ
MRKIMAPPSTLDDHTRESDSRSQLRVRFESAEELRDEFHQNIARGALFIPTVEPYGPHQTVDVTLDLAFCDRSLSLSGEVIVVVDRTLAEVGMTTAGISLRLTEAAPALRLRLEGLTGLDLAQPAPTNRAERRSSARSRSDADIVISSPNGEFSGTTANICYTGVLAFIPMVSIPVGTVVRVHLSNPVVELDLAVDGKIIHSRRCDGGVTAHGIQLHYPADRIDQVMAFIEFLQSFDRARRLAVVSGEIDASGLGAVLDMFMNTAPSGTLSVSRGKDEGKIVFSEGYILRCTVGMVSGMKALARMVRWTEGRFEFHHELQLPETPDDPQPFEAAMMVASVQADEMARIGFDASATSDTFRIDPEGRKEHYESLTELEREVLDSAAGGFNVETISDVVAAPDADIYKALLVLLDLGVIERD